MNYYDMYVITFENGDVIIIDENLSRKEEDLFKLIAEQKYIKLGEYILDTDKINHIKCYNKKVKVYE